MSSFSIKRALISVFDKTDLEPLVEYLVANKVTIISTGGTYKKIQSILCDQHTNLLQPIEQLTNSPEILNGRVKTLHPTVYGGLLAKRNNPDHQQDLNLVNTDYIDLVVVNLYPFHRSFDDKLPLEEAQELIDIGGVSLIRASAKNYQDVILLTKPDQYQNLIQHGPNYIDRAKLAIEGFKVTSTYDAQITQYLKQLPPQPPQVISAEYKLCFPLKYGSNPHQTPAGVYSISRHNQDPQPLPFKVLNGQLGAINVLDAINSWNLVNEVTQALKHKDDYTFTPYCAASFKHTSPAGVAIANRNDETPSEAYLEAIDISRDQWDHSLSQMARAYIRARNCDPMSSFGDFVALSHTCDVATAKLLKREVSDGIIAPSYDPEALEILKTKKSGKYIILEGAAYSSPQQPPPEIREIGGLAIIQPRNHLTAPIPDNLPRKLSQTMTLANITLKWAQSNTVAMAYNGQVIAIASGQQSRVDCVKLCARKSCTWFLRQHPLVNQYMSRSKMGPYVNGSPDQPIKRQDRINMITRCIEGDLSEWEYNHFEDFINHHCDSADQSPLNGFMGHFHKYRSLDEYSQYLKDFFPTKDIILASDAFFPFRDNIDIAAQYGVTHVIHPGGSQADDLVQKACEEYGISMITTGVRQFTH